MQLCRFWDFHQHRKIFFIVFFQNFVLLIIKQKNLLYRRLACVKADFGGIFCGLPTTSPQSSRSAVCCFMTMACSVFSAVQWASRGRRGSSNGRGMGRHWQRNAPCLQVRGPPTAPLLEQSRGGLWTSLTDGIKGMCKQHERPREYKVTGRVDKTVIKYFADVRTSRYCWWTPPMQTRRLMNEHTDINHSGITRSLYRMIIYMW